MSERRKLGEMTASALYKITVMAYCTCTCRGDDFPFQKIAFSVWENSEFCFKGLSKWKFRLAIDTVHKNYVYKRNTNYESGYFQRVT